MAKESNKPVGTRTSGKKSLAFKITQRKNKREREKAKRLSLSNARKRQRMAAANERRAQKAIKKGNVTATTSTVQVSPKRSITIKPAKTTSAQVKKFRPVEVRAGSSKTFGKERAKGVAAPSPTKSTLQAKIAAARSKGQDLVTHKGLVYRAGTTTTKTVKKTTPAVTGTFPPITKQVTKVTPNIKRKQIKLKSRQGGIEAVPVNARVRAR